MLKHYKIPLKFTPQVTVSYSLPDTKTKRILNSLLKTRDREERRNNPLLKKPLPSKQFLVREISRKFKEKILEIRQIPLRIMEIFALFVHGKFADKGNYETVLQRLEEFIILQYLFDSQYLNKNSQSQADLEELKILPRLIPNITEFAKMAQDQEIIKHFNKIKLRVNKMLHVTKPDFLNDLFTFKQKKLDLSLCIEIRGKKYFEELYPILPKAKKVERLAAQGSIQTSVESEKQKLVFLLDEMRDNKMKVPYLKIQGTIEEIYLPNFERFLREAPNLIHAFNISGLQFGKDSGLNTSLQTLRGSLFLEGLVNLNLSQLNVSKLKADISQILQNTPNLELLDLSGCTFNREQFRTLTRSLNAPWIKNLAVFIGNQITITTPKFEPEFAAFVQSLGQHAKQLKELDLCDVKIEDTTGEQIRDLVLKCEKMHAIDIRNNYISKRGLMDILLSAIQSKNMYSYKAEGNKQKIQEGLFLDIPREIFEQINEMINQDKYPLLASQKSQVKDRVKSYLKRHTITRWLQIFKKKSHHFMSVGVDPALRLKRKQLLKQAKVFRPQYDNAIEESKRAQLFNAQAAVVQLTKSQTMAPPPAIAPMPAPAQPYNPASMILQQPQAPKNKAKIMPEPQRAFSQNTMPMNQFQTQNSGPMLYTQQTMPMQSLNMSGLMQQPTMQPGMFPQQFTMQQPMMQSAYGMTPQGMPYQLLPQNINLQQGASIINQRGQVLGQAMQGMFQGGQVRNYK